MSLDRYRLEELVAVQWNPVLADQFPNADHRGCRQEMWHDGSSWHAYTPARCVGYHCPYCGGACGSYGHHGCRKA